VTFLPRMTGQQWASLPRTLLDAVEMIALPPLPTAEAPSSSTSIISEDFDRYWTFLNNPRVETIDPSAEVTVLGWYYDSQSAQWPVFKAYGEGGQVIPFSETRQASADLQRHFSDVGAGYNRFQIRFRCPNTCAIGALTSSPPELRLALDRDRPLSVASGSAQLYVDSVSGGAYAKRINNVTDEFAANVRGGLSRLYLRLLPLLLCAGLIAAIAASWRAIRTRSLAPLLPTALAAWALVATRIVILALIHASSFPAINISYSAPAQYAAVVAAFLSIAAVARNATLRRNSRMSRLDELDIVIRRKNGKTLASIPQFNLYAKGENVEAAVAALDAKKKELAAELEETGEFEMLEIDNRRANLSRGAPGSTFADLGRFAIKVGIVAFCIAAALSISGVIVGSKIENAINNVKSVKIGGAQFWSRMEAELDRMASPVNDVPEAKKQKLLADVRAIAIKWHPFVVEIQSALGSQAGPSQPPALKDK
jgi:outer membrane lipoprotein SlyB